MAAEIAVARGNSQDVTNAVGRPRVSLNSISVYDSSWRFSTGKSRPSGTGNWAFSIGSKEAFHDIDKAFWANGKYSDAVKEAKKEAQKRGVRSIYVMP